MNAMNQALSVYNKSKAAIAARVATVQDEVVVALWELTQEQDRTINSQAYQLSILESQNSEALDNCADAQLVLNQVRALH